MAQVLLVAASGLARETIESIRQTEDHEVVGILDDCEKLHGSEVLGVPVLGGLNLAAERGEQLLLCPGKGAVRRIIEARLNLPANRYATHVHRSSIISESCTVGAGSIILAGCIATAEVSIGNHVVLMPQVVLTHDDRIANYATLAAGVRLAGNVSVGEQTYVGTNATVRENLNIGANAVLGMASALLKDVPEGETWAGSPAQKLYDAWTGPIDVVFKTSAKRRIA